MAQYNSACLSLTRETTPDPYVTFSSGHFYMTFTAGDRVEIWKASSLPDFAGLPQKHVVWSPPPNTFHSADLWAPELHALRGRWYIYYAAADPAHGNKSHRMYILGGPPVQQDPTEGPWEFLGPIKGMGQRQWAIDGTVIELDHTLYFVYSGWPFDNKDDSELTQELFILRLSDPTTADSAPTCICQPHESWERSDASGINEGPQFLQSPDKRWTGLVYSCAGSWTCDYKMNTLKYIGGDPLSRMAWQKGTRPLIINNEHGTGPWGPGHGSFIHIEQEVFGIYHATDAPDDGWNNRKARMQRITFKDGEPFMDYHVGRLASSWPEFLRREIPSKHSSHSKSTLGSLVSRMTAKFKDEL